MQPSKRALQEAYTEAVRAASRLSVLGAIGFGVALAMAAVLAERDAFFAPGYGLELGLLAGGVGGGVVFTFLALRAAGMARACRQQLAGTPRPSTPGRDRRPGSRRSS